MKQFDRRKFLKLSARCLGATVLFGGAGLLIFRSRKDCLYQINPESCVACDKCETACILHPSAVKCVNDFSTCGYCHYCYAYFIDGLSENPENLVCPTGALKRKQVGEFQFEHTIEERLCTGCGKCVKRCSDFGNSSLRLEIRRNLCKECNRCAIEKACPSKAVQQIQIPT